MGNICKTNNEEKLNYKYDDIYDKPAIEVSNATRPKEEVIKKIIKLLGSEFVNIDDATKRDILKKIEEKLEKVKPFSLECIVQKIEERFIQSLAKLQERINKIAKPDFSENLQNKLNQIRSGFIDEVKKNYEKFGSNSSRFDFARIFDKIDRLENRIREAEDTKKAEADALLDILNELKKGEKVYINLSSFRDHRDVRMKGWTPCKIESINLAETKKSFSISLWEEKSKSATVYRIFPKLESMKSIEYKCPRAIKQFDNREPGNSKVEIYSDELKLHCEELHDQGRLDTLDKSKYDVANKLLACIKPWNKYVLEKTAENARDCAIHCTSTIQSFALTEEQKTELREDYNLTFYYNERKNCTDALLNFAEDLKKETAEAVISECANIKNHLYEENKDLFDLAEQKTKNGSYVHTRNIQPLPYYDELTDNVTDPANETTTGLFIAVLICGLLFYHLFQAIICLYEITKTNPEEYTKEDKDQIQTKKKKP